MRNRRAKWLAAAVALQGACGTGAATIAWPAVPRQGRLALNHLSAALVVAACFGV
jgi:hypothetical protein